MAKKRGPVPRWTPDEDEALGEILEEGGSYAEAGDELGRTAGAVRHRCSRLGLKTKWGHPSDPYRRSVILVMLSEGRNLTEIARVLEVYDSTVQRTVVRMVKDGLVVRDGNNTRNVRYIPVGKEEGQSAHATKEVVEARRANRIIQNQQARSA